MAQGRAYLVVLLALSLLACNTHKQKIYTSECAPDIKFKKVNFRNLIDSIKLYDKQYVEVSGRYLEGKHISALVNDSTFSDHGNSRSLWVNFTQECPLYLKGKNTGLFETEDGEYNKINNRQMTIRGRVELQKKGHKETYRATINEVSYLELD
ncbi:hypothetical protein EWM62_04610 [Mucilaginibacter terrigena]|uniref:Uncharacterized protein n=1 Tax=Mucilaginibacter terrigena TaxID=2492395 RepID=A0A4Q5LPA4_9SPHI|nr:hypothetical protein [Mucilaginibacter terrigena]RYU91226.1 hypothetical protein EWM62_04610 [Mucilaginibacter terrigena]